MKRRQLTIGAAIAILALASIAFAKAQDPGTALPTTPAVQGSQEEASPAAPVQGGWLREGRIAYMQKKLGLTDEQKRTMRQLYAAYRDQTRQARMSLLSLKDEKRTMLISGKVDQKKLAQIDDQVVKLVTELLTQRLKMKRDRLALLTPEQIDRLGGLVAKKALRGEMRKMHRRGEHDRGHF